MTRNITKVDASERQEIANKNNKKNDTRRTDTSPLLIPQWLKDQMKFDGWDLGGYPALANWIRCNSHLAMTLADISKPMLRLAANEYCNDWQHLEADQQQELVSNFQEMIKALITVGAIRVSSQIDTEQFWHPIEKCPKENGTTYLIRLKSGSCITGRYNQDDKLWEGDAYWYEKWLFEHYAEIPALEAGNE